MVLLLQNKHRYIRRIIDILSNFFISFLLLVASSHIHPMEFQYESENKNPIVGQIQKAIVRKDDDISEIAYRYKVGYFDLVEANPNIDPDDPGYGKRIIIPTVYVIPQEIKKNSIVINLAEMHLYFLNKEGNKIYVFPIGIGKYAWGTPTGKYQVSEKIKNPKWVVPDSIWRYRTEHGEKMPRIFPSGKDNPLGKLAIRLSWGTYMIHGTDDQYSIGKRSSAGCIRMYEKDIETLYELVSIGTSVTILNEPYKAGLLNGKLYLESHIPLKEQRDDGEMSYLPEQVMNAIESVDQNGLIDISWDKIFEIAKKHLGYPISVN